VETNNGKKLNRLPLFLGLVSIISLFFENGNEWMPAMWIVILLYYFYG
jgi:hypothetical protein